MTQQLKLFEEIGIEYFRIGADKLLDALNLGLKQKEKYQIEYYCQYEKLLVLIACNREKHIVCNVVDENGNVPKDFCVNWRIHQEVIRELKIELL